jgi:bacterioferritin-associated ferredoxin
MYICLCKAVTDQQIREAVRQGATSLKALRNNLDVMTQCGKCACATKSLLESTVAEAAQTTPYYQVA